MVACSSPTHSARTVVGAYHDELGIPNQDAHLSLPPHIFAVLDGHGPEGHNIASRAAHALLSNLRALLENPACTPHTALRSAFAATAELLHSNPHAEASGTTASVAVVHDATVTVANVGDSDIVLCQRRSCAMLTAHHRVSLEAERKRVAAAGALVRDGYVCDPHTDKMIALTRAFGDLDVKHLGLIATPHIAQFAYEHDDVLILATDGLWDAHGGIKPGDAARVVRKVLDDGGNVNNVADQLVSVARGGEQQLPFDDATVIVVKLATKGKT